MIPATRKPAEKPEPQDEIPGPAQLITLIDVDFNFGPDDIGSFVLFPEDRLNASLGAFTIDIVANEANGRYAEHIEIPRTFVRWWARRERTVAIPRSFDPAVANR